ILDVLAGLRIAAAQVGELRPAAARQCEQERERLPHAFFPSWTSPRPAARGAAVRLAIETRSAMFWAIFISACDSGSPGSAATIGRPSSLPARIAGLIGTRPRNGTESFAAACSAPPLEKMSVSV